MSAYEQEIMALIKFKPGEYEDRQDYLASLIRATDKWLAKHDANGDIFDGWDEPLANWFDEAIHAMNAKRHIPDLPDMELGEEDMVPDEQVEDTEDGAESGNETVSSEGPQPGGAVGDSQASPAGEPEAQPAEPSPKAKPPPGPRYRKKTPTSFDHLTGEKDRFGVVIGTKTHAAVQLYEKGVTAKELREKVGGTHYNILNKLVKAGHVVEKDKNGVFTLVHKDDLKKPD